jgi:hypothetical protein
MKKLWLKVCISYWKKKQLRLFAKCKSIPVHYIMESIQFNYNMKKINYYIHKLEDTCL